VGALVAVAVGVGATDRQLVYVSCANPTDDPFNDPYRAYLHAALLSVAGLFPGVTQVSRSVSAFTQHSSVKAPSTGPVAFYPTSLWGLVVPEAVPVVCTTS
jgi:hypothetical protein